MSDIQAMGCFQKLAAALVVASLLLLACQGTYVGVAYHCYLFRPVFFVMCMSDLVRNATVEWKFILLACIVVS